MVQIGSRAYGLTLVAGAAVLWSTAGFFVRLIELDVWTMLGWRSLFAGLSLLAVTAFQNGRNTPRAFRAIGKVGAIAILLAAVSMGSYVVALKLTSVANVMTVYATVPFVAAAIAFFWIGERISARLLLAGAVGAIGIAIMAGSATRPTDIAGNGIAFLMTLAFATQLVMARRYPSLNMAPVNAGGAAICAVICWPMMAGGIPELPQLIVVALFGITNSALAYILFLTGGRHIPSGEAGLMGLLDVVLGPLWVWLVFREYPGRAAILGGSTVLAAVVWYLSAGLGGRQAAQRELDEI
ncbi:MAG: DMT family transporter [Hyphomicrobiales bacterium]